VRVVSFLPVEPKALVEKLAYDPELVARLGELIVRLPALRDFAEDVPDLAALMLVRMVEARACPQRRLSVAALNALRYHAWPGNLAELQSVVKNLALSALDEEVGLEDVERVLAAHAPTVSHPGLALDRPYREAREGFERIYFENLLAQEHGSMSRVAERSGLERTHLYRKLKALGCRSAGGKKVDWSYNASLLATGGTRVKIVILGAGQVGASVAESLVSEQNDITVVDVDPARLRTLQDRFDLRTVTGSASHPSVLAAAGIEDADLLIAVTQHDETNLVACKIAARLFNVPRRIARVRATDYLNDEKVLGPDGFEVDLMICPSRS
jgi:hypothetical protein